MALEKPNVIGGELILRCLLWAGEEVLINQSTVKAISMYAGS